MSLIEIPPWSYWKFLRTQELIQLARCCKLMRVRLPQIPTNALMTQLDRTGLQFGSIWILENIEIPRPMPSVKVLAANEVKGLHHLPKLESMYVARARASDLVELTNLKLLCIRKSIDMNAECYVEQLLYRGHEPLDITQFPNLKSLNVHVTLHSTRMQLGIEFGDKKCSVLDAFRGSDMCPIFRWVIGLPRISNVSITLYMGLLNGFNEYITAIHQCPWHVNINLLKPMVNLTKLMYITSQKSITIHCRNSRFHWWPKLDYIVIDGDNFMGLIGDIATQIGPDNHSPLSFECDGYRDKNYVIITNDEEIESVIVGDLVRVFGIQRTTSNISNNSSPRT